MEHLNFKGTARKRWQSPKRGMNKEESLSEFQLPMKRVRSDGSCPNESSSPEQKSLRLKLEIQNEKQSTLRKLEKDKLKLVSQAL